MIYKPTDQLNIERYDLVEAKVSTGQFRWMDITSHRWTALLEQTLYREVNRLFEVAPETVYWERFGNVLSQVTHQPIYIFECNGQKRGLLLLDDGFTYSMMSGKIPGLAEQQLSLEEFLGKYQKEMQALLIHILRDYERAWEPIERMELRLKRVTTHQHRARVMLPFERTLVCPIVLKHASAEGKGVVRQGGQTRMLLCLPYAAIDKTLSRLSPRKVWAPESIEDAATLPKGEFNALLMEQKYDVVSEVGTVRIQNTGQNLEAGQVLSVGDYNGQVTLRINGFPMFTGNMGASNGKLAVRVSGMVDDKRPSVVRSGREFQPMNLPVKH
jgi:flagellar motor switch protein FliM|tara:strand:+ start:1220 stop:2203 length:984 start_codon:yes stop_codon:yes gene_type:complete